MSVRRLAEDQFQPAAFAFNKENAVWAEKTIQKYPDGRQQSAIIPLMMRAQEQEGWVTKAAIETIADMLDMAYIRALEVATFYTQFQLNPVGTRAHVQVCGTTPCMLRGAEGLIKVCKSRINDHAFDRNADGTLSWEEVECQGACVNAPMVVIGKDTYEDLTPARLEEIIDAFAAGKGHEIQTGPQIDRVFSAPEGGLTSLLSDEAKAKSVASKTAKATAEAVATPPSEIAPEKADAAKKPSLDDKDRPAGIERPAQPDDLQLISGVGPKIEGTLHELGIFTFAQIASWHEAERHWVDGYLNFKGRIERDEWVRQAEALAKGGEAEYIKVFGKKPR
ncbi:MULTISPECIES: NADH-quinone oxidoreductase subunit NuoE [unclassified Rhizobium]|jgi:NADH-quinone oxidoreductase subunit E|uniref:NADH-quinone oxidoreductase subunit NuoE n=1 Tax=unclassified Rhizobium TaxID=2613769 RepID=UPI000645FCBD|nr:MULTISPECIES: NADH-quinone oxidoreductase subunit NuoE [unclassified Rhizobium]MBN8953906.1 NADH-quinone oxidoreductase subunit NuoE [Rhizobium tropici]OJY69363.1 MAG: NADH-quinone oxidoreductase subunit E [Rhizobium sp. 60-20]RKD73734.1 NADH dehydrogenase subunit E [Rhizobium sp. WW_1]